jgi:hypothetical protein
MQIGCGSFADETDFASSAHVGISSIVLVEPAPSLSNMVGLERTARGQRTFAPFLPSWSAERNAVLSAGLRNGCAIALLSVRPRLRPRSTLAKMTAQQTIQLALSTRTADIPESMSAAAGASSAARIALDGATFSFEGAVLLSKK